MKNIIVTGSLAYDFIMDFPGNFADNIDPSKLHILNLSFLVNTLKKEKGGTAGNIAYSLSLLNTPVSIVGAVGEDFAEYKKFLDKSGIDTSQIKIIKNEFTSQAFITTDKKDNQITAFYPGAMSNLPKVYPLGINLKGVTLKSTFVVISPNHPQSMIKFAKSCQKLKIPYMFDPGMQLPRLTDHEILSGIKGAEILIGNDYEMGLIKTRLRLTNADLLKLTKIIITTLGEKGSIITTQEESTNIKAGKVKGVLDPTGAGDAYRSGFMAGFIRGFALKVCGQMGSIASCYAVEKYGTTNHTFSKTNFCQRYAENFNEEIRY